MLTPRVFSSRFEQRDVDAVFDPEHGNRFVWTSRVSQAIFRVPVSGYEFTTPPEKLPETKPASSGGPPQPPPRPPKLTARDLFEPGEPGGKIFVPDYVEVKQLAGLLGLKPFKVAADLLELKIFKDTDEFIDFSTAATVAKKHGVVAERL